MNDRLRYDLLFVEWDLKLYSFTNELLPDGLDLGLWVRFCFLKESVVLFFVYFLLVVVSLVVSTSAVNCLEKHIFEMTCYM